MSPRAQNWLTAETTADMRLLLAQVLDQVECRHVTLTGGEPTLRADLPEIVSYLAAREVSVTLISNGQHLTTIVSWYACGGSLFTRLVREAISNSARPT